MKKIITTALCLILVLSLAACGTKSAGKGAADVPDGNKPYNSSSSFRYGLSEVFCDGQSFCMYIEKLNAPEVYDAMMSGWFVVFEAEKDDIAGCTDFDAQLRPAAA